MSKAAEVKRPTEEPDAGLPAWMMTFGDMNMILLVFFVLMFALLTTDKIKYLKIEEDLVAMAYVGRVERTSAARDVSGETAARAFEQMMTKQPGESEVKQINGHQVKLQRLREGVVLTLGGELDPFDEGSWKLKPSHEEVLKAVKKFLVGTRKFVEIRGHTSGNPRDSVILESVGGQLRIRRFTDADFGPDAMKKADFSMLGWLRANEVQKFMIERHAELEDDVVLRPGLIRIRSDAYTRPLGPAHEFVPAKERAINHRVEIVLTDEVDRGE